MNLASGALTLACLFIVAGCAQPSDRKEQAQLRERLMDDTDERKARLQALGTLTPQEYAIMAKKMGWTSAPAPGLPAAPTVEELEKRVREAGAKP
ncbi:MAG: hypothetical protein RIS38_124 [Verrucomicrobiota bacterium]|jgi:hypothetical protein